MRIVAVVPTWRGQDRLPTVIAALSGAATDVVIVHNGTAEPHSETQTAAGASRGHSGGEANVAGERGWSAALGWSPAPGAPSQAATTSALVKHHLALQVNAGFAAAANLGIQRALALEADAVLLVNDDALFQAGAVAALRAELAAHPDAAAVSAHMCYADRPTVLNGAGGQIIRWRGLAKLRGDGELDRGQYAASPTVDYPSGAACLIRRSALERLGLFDEAYYLYYEDAEWGCRAQAAGYTIRYAPLARVLHGGCTSTSDDPARRRYYNVRNRLRFAARHTRPVGWAWAWLATLVLLLKQPLRWLTPWRRRDAAAVVWGVLDHLTGRYGRSQRFG